MAGDWMKVELELPDKPEVHYIAGALNLTPAEVVGHLIRIWAWFNKHTENGHAYGVTHALLDRITGVTGIGEVMMFAGWLEQHDKTLCMPKFDRHTSESSKKRALASERQSRKRHAPSVTKALPEKRREEISTKTAPGARISSKSELPADWQPGPQTVEGLSREFGLVPEDVVRYVAAFHDACHAKGYRYKDFDAAFRNCVRQDWPHLRQNGTTGPRRVAAG